MPCASSPSWDRGWRRLRRGERKRAIGRVTVDEEYGLRRAYPPRGCSGVCRGWLVRRIFGSAISGI